MQGQRSLSVTCIHVAKYNCVLHITYPSQSVPSTDVGVNIRHNNNHTTIAEQPTTTTTTTLTQSPQPASYFWVGISSPYMYTLTYYYTQVTKLKLLLTTINK